MNPWDYQAHPSKLAFEPWHCWEQLYFCLTWWNAVQFLGKKICSPSTKTRSTTTQAGRPMKLLHTRKWWTYQLLKFNPLKNKGHTINPFDQFQTLKKQFEKHYLNCNKILANFYQVNWYMLYWRAYSAHNTNSEIKGQVVSFSVWQMGISHWGLSALCQSIPKRGR